MRGLGNVKQGLQEKLNNIRYRKARELELRNQQIAKADLNNLSHWVVNAKGVNGREDVEFKNAAAEEIIRRARENITNFSDFAYHVSHVSTYAPKKELREAASAMFLGKK